MMEKHPKNLYRHSLGRWGEDIALKFLEQQGFVFISRNYRTPDGEVDLIMSQKDQLVFIEVKTRKNIEFGLPEDAITDEKMEHITAAAEWFLQQNPEYGEDWRIDVISVIGTQGGPEPQIDWFENVS